MLIGVSILFGWKARFSIAGNDFVDTFNKYRLDFSSSNGDICIHVYTYKECDEKEKKCVASILYYIHCDEWIS